MATRIEIIPAVPDARTRVKKDHFNGLGLMGRVAEVQVADIYTLDARLSPKQMEAAAEALANPRIEISYVGRSFVPKKFDAAIEIGFLPGVTDNVGTTARETVGEKLGRAWKPGEGAYSSRLFFVSFAGGPGKGRDKTGGREEDLAAIAESLHNPLIQSARTKTRAKFIKDKGMGVLVPKVSLHEKAGAMEVDLWLDDEQLALIGSQGIEDADDERRGPLALDLESLKTIRSYFHKLGRKPTDIELESLAQTWSEHCKHTIFADPMDNADISIFKTYIKAATYRVRKDKGRKDFCASVFSDNSGAIDFDAEYLVTHKVETHNSPSALDPFGGAITGIVGVNRDTLGFGLGAKPVVNTYGFCFADPRDDSDFYRDEARTQKLLSARRILDGVVAGVNTGGNCSGIPTPQGFVCFDARYRGKPLVFVGTVGLIPKKLKGGRVSYEKRARAGDYIVMTGGRVGLDGIHGATFSSVALDSGSPATAVQIGDPITQKKMSDVIVKEARDLGLYSSITDNGAGGLSCSVAEMAKECGGCEVQLEKVPLKYPGLAPWQIWISESQERMTLAVPPAKWPALRKLMQKRGVEATVIGRFTDGNKCVVRQGGKTIMDLDMDFLHEGRPIRFLQSAPVLPEWQEPEPPARASGTVLVKRLLARPNLSSFAFISEQYDHEVQGGSVTKPLQGRGRVNAEATVTKPVPGSPRAVVLSQALYPWYAEGHPYNMAAAAIDGAVRAAVAAGGDPDYLAILDNFCWTESNDPVRLGQLKDAARACYDTAVAYGTPFISGKDSMFNDFQGYDASGVPAKISVLPTLLVSAIGVMRDAYRAVTLDAKAPGDHVYVLGETREELGGSEYYWMLAEEQGMEHIGRAFPEVRAAANLKLYRKLHEAIGRGLVASAISVSRGGLAIALLKTALGGRLGLDADLAKIPGAAGGGTKKDAKKLSDTGALFSESAGRILVTVAPERADEFEKAMKGVACARIGEVTKNERVRVAGRETKTLVNLTLKDAARAYQETFKGF
jgi:phosphoribosylformylglycinamidine synthase